MNRIHFGLAVVAATIAIVTAAATPNSGVAMGGQPTGRSLHPTAQPTRGGGPGLHPTAQPTRGGGPGLPAFEVDRTWPNVPAKWKLGDVSSFAVDARDNVWLLHRPRTLLKPEDAALAAPPVIVFDAAGSMLKAWGGPGSGYEWPQREHGIHLDHKGFVWISGNNCPTNGIAGL